MSKYEIKRGLYSLSFDYIESHTSDDVWCEEPVVRVSVGTPDGAHCMSLRMDAVSDLIIYLQNIRKTEQTGK